MCNCSAGDRLTCCGGAVGGCCCSDTGYSYKLADSCFAGTHWPAAPHTSVGIAELSTNLREVHNALGPRVFSLLKVPTGAFTMKTLYAKQGPKHGSACKIGTPALTSYQ